MSMGVETAAVRESDRDDGAAVTDRRATISAAWSEIRSGLRSEEHTSELQSH